MDGLGRQREEEMAAYIALTLSPSNSLVNVYVHFFLFIEDAFNSQMK